VLAFHDLGGRYADRIEVETTHTRNGANFERSDCCGFPGSRGACYDEYAGDGHDWCIDLVGLAQPNALVQLRAILL
jgi:hypothetical protein